MPAASQPPPSSAIPGKSGGSAPYVLGVLVFAALIGGLICWKSKDGDEVAPKPPTTASAQVKNDPPPTHAPPPPPPIEEDAGVEEAGAKPTNAGTGKAAGPGPCSGKCGDGQSSPALNSALSGTAQSAQGCYNRALRTSEVSGSMTVSVQVGPQGQVCSAAIANDSVGSGEISSCVLGRFRGKSFPPPTSGCVVVNIPISFKLKQ